MKIYKPVSTGRTSTDSEARIKACICFTLTGVWVIVVLKEKSTLKHTTYGCIEIFTTYLASPVLISGPVLYFHYSREKLTALCCSDITAGDC